MINPLKWFNFFGKSSAATARDRLQIVIAHEHSERDAPDFLLKLKQEIITVIEKYVAINPQKIKINMQNENNCSILELNITLPKTHGES